MLPFRDSIREEQFTEIYKTYYKKLLTFCIKFVKSRELAESIVQDVFITFWEKFDEIDSKEKISSYLYTIVNNRMVDCFRKIDAFERVKEEVKHSMDASYEHIESEIAGKDFKQAAEKAINRLPEKRKEIFDLSRRDEMSNDQIAKQLSISPHTVKNQLQKADKHLRRELGLYLIPS